MKTIYTVFALCALLIASYNANAQVATSSKQHLFDKFSSKIPTAMAELDKAFIGGEGTSIQLNFGGNFSISGTVSSFVQRYSNLSSVLIKLPSLHNSLLSISKRVNDDKSITYVGRIINEKYADGYELSKDTNGNYAFSKIKTDDLIQDF